jgi:2-dehydropantoate 2-reductase
VTRYVFIGAGAIGSAVGGLLGRSGSDVLLVARGDHARAMIDGGLTVRCPDAEFTVPVPTVTGPQDATLTPDDVLVLTTKTHQADAALNQWADVPVRDGDEVVGRAADLLPVFTALNGVASEEIALRYFDRVFAVCVWFPAVMIDPGQVIVRSVPLRGVFHIGRYGASPDPDADAKLLDGFGRDWEAAGCRVTMPEAVMEWKYRKLLSNLGNVFQALLGEADGGEDLREAADREAREIPAAARIAYTSDATEQAARQKGFTVRPVPGEPEQLGGSSWQSLVRGTGTIETDYLNGEIALIARRIGRRAPVNARLTALARDAARNNLRPGSMTVDRLRAELGG